MNAYPLLGLPLVSFLVLGSLQQDVVLTDPNSSSQSARTPAGDTTVAVYDMKDLVDKLAPAPDVDADLKREDLERKLQRYLQGQDHARLGGLGYAGHDPKAVAKKFAAEERMAVTRDYADVIQRSMKPGFEPASQQLTVPSEGLLVGNLRAEQHAWLASFLDLQRRTNGLVEISITIYEAPKGAFRDAGLAEASKVLEDPAALTALRARLRADKAVVEVNSPRLAVLNGQKASISVLDQVSYVKEWKLTLVEPGPQEIADPTIDIVQDGIVAHFRTIALDADVYALDIAFVMSKLDRPMATRKVRISATSDREVEIGVPVVTKIHFESKLVLSDGAAATFTTASPAKDKDLAIVLTLEHRPLEAEPR